MSGSSNGREDLKAAVGCALTALAMSIVGVLTAVISAFAALEWSNWVWPPEDEAGSTQVGRLFYMVVSMPFGFLAGCILTAVMRGRIKRWRART